MGVSYEEAEELKVNGDQSGNLPEEIVSIIDSSLRPFSEEIKKILDFYLSSVDERSIDCCYITGGASLTSGLSQTLTAELGINVLFFNPFEKFSVTNSDLDNKDSLRLISSVGSTSMGLAMRRLRDDQG